MSEKDSSTGELNSQLRTRVVSGIDSVDRLGELARELGGSSVLIVTDSGIISAGHVDRALRSLQRAQLVVQVFDGVRENPTTHDVDACLEVARESGIDVLIGFGGGSSMDTAKGCNFLLSNGGRMWDYWGVGKANKPMLPMIAVPTTAGTGSECQSFALIADEETHQKMACGDPKAAPVIAVLDPTLTVTQPRQVTANTGIDAVAHALETAVTRTRTEQSWHYSCDAFRLTAGNLSSVLESPDCIDSRAGMQLGACHAGLAIELSMLGAAHSAANPLTARFGITHGRAVGMMLPHVVRFNAEEPDARAAYEKMATFVLSSDESTEPTVDGLVACLESLLRTADFPESLVECGVTDDVVPELAIEAADQWTAKFNPRSVSVSDFDALYRSALGS